MSEFQDGTTPPEATGPGGLTMLIKQSYIDTGGRFSFYCRPPNYSFSVTTMEQPPKNGDITGPHRLDVFVPIDGRCAFFYKCPICKRTYQILICEG